jgi:hypothetical protein
MSTFPSRFLAVIAAVTLVGVVNMPPVSADSPASTCNSGTLVTATLKVDGVSVPVNTSMSALYALTVCRVPEMRYYSIQVGLLDGGVLKEELTLGNLNKIFEVTFRPTTGDTPTVADFNGRVQTFVIGSDVVVSVKPTAVSKVDDPTRACAGKEFTDATCVNRLATRDLAAFVSGSVRFETSSNISNYSKLAGATVSASANIYDISLSGPCPTATSSFTGNDGGANIPSSGGFSSETTTLMVKMVGPHFKINGSTLNTGSLEVFIPKETITACFGGTATELASTLGMTRTAAGVTADVLKISGVPTTGLQYAVTVIGDALKISVTAVSFSDPTYNLLLHKAAVATTATTVPATGSTTTTVPATGATTTTVVSGGASSNLTTLIQTNAVLATQLSRTTGRTAKSLAAQANLAVLTGSTVSLKVVTSTAKYCKVTGTNIKGVNVGSCKVTVTVKPKKGMSHSKTLTLKVV